MTDLTCAVSFQSYRLNKRGRFRGHLLSPRAKSMALLLPGTTRLHSISWHLRGAESVRWGIGLFTPSHLHNSFQTSIEKSTILIGRRHLVEKKAWGKVKMHWKGKRCDCVASFKATNYKSHFTRNWLVPFSSRFWFIWENQRKEKQFKLNKSLKTLLN